MISIPEFYTDRSIFITGGTGFIGKVLIEKLLRSCPRIKSLYVLMRPKGGVFIKDRLEKLLDEPVFNRLREDQPDFKSKVYAVSGDITEPRLGISESDEARLISEVSIVFHSAATVRFDEQLRIAVDMNLLPVRKLIQLCRKFQKLDALVHVSTAFSNCDREYIEEKAYPCPVQPQKLIDAIEWMDDEMVNLVTSKLIGRKPNTYTYTKHLAETLLIEEGEGLPIAIIRPSIVGASWKEPMPGWVDNFNGPSGLYVAVGKGILRVLKINQECVADIVPVDLPVNMMIALGWYTGLNKPETVPIFHCTSESVNPFSWGEMEPVLMEHFKKIPYEACFRRPNFVLLPNSDGLLLKYWYFVSHMIPAYIADLGYKVMGKKPRMVKTYNKIHKTMDTLEYFTHNSWHWSQANLDMLKAQLNPEDKKNFYMDTRMLDWQSYLSNYLMGTKQYVLKEDMSALPLARAHLIKLRNIRYTFNAILAVIFWRLLIARSQIARNLWYLIMGLVFKFVRFFRPLSN